MFCLQGQSLFVHIFVGHIKGFNTLSLEPRSMPLLQFRKDHLRLWMMKIDIKHLIADPTECAMELFNIARSRFCENGVRHPEGDQFSFFFVHPSFKDQSGQAMLELAHDVPLSEQALPIVAFQETN